MATKIIWADPAQFRLVKIGKGRVWHIVHVGGYEMDYIFCGIRRADREYSKDRNRRPLCRTCQKMYMDFNYPELQRREMPG